MSVSSDILSLDLRWRSFWLRRAGSSDSPRISPGDIQPQVAEVTAVKRTQQGALSDPQHTIIGSHRLENRESWHFTNSRIPCTPSSRSGLFVGPVTAAQAKIAVVGHDRKGQVFTHLLLTLISMSLLIADVHFRFLERVILALLMLEATRVGLETSYRQHECAARKGVEGATFLGRFR